MVVDLAESAKNSAACIGWGTCETACPKAISIENIAVLRPEYLRAAFPPP